MWESVCFTQLLFPTSSHLPLFVTLPETPFFPVAYHFFFKSVDHWASSRAHTPYYISHNSLIFLPPRFPPPRRLFSFIILFLQLFGPPLLPPFSPNLKYHLFSIQRFKGFYFYWFFLLFPSLQATTLSNPLHAQAKVRQKLTVFPSSPPFLPNHFQHFPFVLSYAAYPYIMRVLLLLRRSFDE